MIFVYNLMLRVNFSVMAVMTVMIATTDVRLQEKSQAQFWCYGCYGTTNEKFKLEVNTHFPGVSFSFRLHNFIVSCVMAVMTL